uniref:Tyrosine-protein phosphatase domain-containing protein n=1 Tax=Macrostomum lignano TaxID=282301 RepID=A0A1I8IH67_9PLAT
YRLVYETVCACVTCRQTSVRVFQFVRRARNLAKRETTAASASGGKSSTTTTAGRSGFEAEFDSLSALARPLSVGDCAGGHRAENRWKSRDVMVQPPERARPYLMTQDSGTDFINAVYVDGHCRANQYIVTQWPLKNTVGDFWKLIRDHQVRVAVVLSEFTGKLGK